MAESPAQRYCAALERAHAKTPTVDLIHLRRLMLLCLWLAPAASVFAGVVVLTLVGDVPLGVTALALGVFAPLVLIVRIRGINRELAKRGQTSPR